MDPKEEYDSEYRDAPFEKRESRSSFSGIRPSNSTANEGHDASSLGEDKDTSAYFGTRDQSDDLARPGQESSSFQHASQETSVEPSSYSQNYAKATSIRRRRPSSSKRGEGKPDDFLNIQDQVTQQHQVALRGPGGFPIPTDDYLDEYEKIKHACQKGRDPSADDQDDEYLPDLEEVIADRQILLKIQTKFKAKVQGTNSLRQKNEELKDQLFNLKRSIAAYEKKISRIGTGTNGQKFIEVPCNHLEDINRLEVLLGSKKNELASLQKHLSKAAQNKLPEGQSLNNLYSKLDVLRAESKKLRQMVVYTEANVHGVEKVNALKGELIDLEAQNSLLMGEVESLKNIKDDQFKQLENIATEKNYPKQLRELFDSLKRLRADQKQTEGSLKQVMANKKTNFEKIIRLEDELRELKARKRQLGQLR